MTMLKDHHDFPCKQNNKCWVDYDKVEFHPGFSVGVYFYNTLTGESGYLNKDGIFNYTKEKLTKNPNKQITTKKNGFVKVILTESEAFALGCVLWRIGGAWGGAHDLLDILLHNFVALQNKWPLAGHICNLQEDNLYYSGSIWLCGILPQNITLAGNKFNSIELLKDNHFKFTLTKSTVITLIHILRCIGGPPTGLHGLVNQIWWKLDGKAKTWKKYITKDIVEHCDFKFKDSELPIYPRTLTFNEGKINTKIKKKEILNLNMRKIVM